ncbi:hypothetical protein V8E52_009109 [Russula decolorans]|jgi:hypothetical protein
MHRLSVIALTLLVVFASVLPTVLARETNGDRFRRGYPPLPPSRRDVAKRQKPSSTPPKTASGFLEVRDSSGAHRLGFVENNESGLPALGVTTDKNSALQGTFSAATKTVQVSNGSPSFLGANDPSGQSGEFLALVSDSSEAKIWSLNAATNELTPNFLTLSAITWDDVHNELELVTDASNSAPNQLVKLYLASN